MIAWRRWRLTDQEHDKLQYDNAQLNCLNAIKKFHEAKELELLRKNNIKRFYNFVNKKTSSQPVIGDIRCPDGSLASSVQKKCNIFNDFFGSVFTIDNGYCPPLESRLPSDCLKLNSIEFTPDVVFSTLRLLKPSSSVGSDSIPNMLLKNCASALCIPLCVLTLLTNYCFILIVYNIVNIFTLSQSLNKLIYKDELGKLNKD